MKYYKETIYITNNEGFIIYRIGKRVHYYSFDIGRWIMSSTHRKHSFFDDRPYVNSITRIKKDEAMAFIVAHKLSR